MADEQFREVSRNAVELSKQHLAKASPVLLTLRQLAEHGAIDLDDDAKLIPQLLATLVANENLSWVSYADETGRFLGVMRDANGAVGVNQSRIGTDGRTRLVESNVDTNTFTWQQANVNPDSGYDPRNRPFYTAAMQADGRQVWLDPYIFYKQNVPGISTAIAVKRDGKNIGVLSVDFTLGTLARHLAALRASNNSRLILFTDDGRLIGYGRQGQPATTQATPKLDSSADGLPTVRGADAVLGAFMNARVTQLEANPAQRVHQFDFDAADEIAGRYDTYFAIAMPFDLDANQRWHVGLMAPEADFLAAAWRSQRNVAILCSIALILAVLSAAVMARFVSRPVRALRERMVRIGADDFTITAPIGGAREFRELSDSLDRMVVELQDGMRLKHSIGVAMQVQKQLLPDHPPIVEGLDVAGFSRYCDETGGDYYDFLTAESLGGNRLMIVVGDVAGHGVGSALMMAGARAVLRDRAAETGVLATLLDRLNALVNTDTRGKQFMTMSVGVIDADAKTYRFASAGHDPAIIYRPASDDFEEMDEAGLPLGVTDDGMYGEFVIPNLSPGDVLLLGTDGLWEAWSTDDQQFGKERVRTAIRTRAHLPASEIVDGLITDLDSFRGIRPAADDITLVLVKFAPVGVLNPRGG